MKNIVSYFNLYSQILILYFYVGHCQGDIYACLLGNNVSCRLACATYGRVTCLTYQNKRACEQYNQQSSSTHFHMNSTSKTSILINDFDALQYSVCLSIGILFFFFILLMIIYLIRKKSFQFLFSCFNKSFNPQLIRKSHPQSSSFDSRYTPAPDLYDLPPSYYYYYSTISINDSYEPPPYPGSSSSLYRSNSIYYETIQTPSMPLLEPKEFPNIRTHCV
jgi:hypothetical protein